MTLDIKTINKQKVGFFRFKKLKKDYLLTNDVGEWLFLNPVEFSSFLSGKIEQTNLNSYTELKEKGFVWDELNFEALSEKYASRHKSLSQGTTLHIIVVSLRCDHACVYCQAQSGSIKEKKLDMDISTAQKVVDMIFESPSKNIGIEFQGGEPLINWDIVKFIIEYAQKKNDKKKKKLTISLVSNLTHMSGSRLEFLTRNDVSICTSLDGPEYLHNKNRIIATKNSYKTTVKWIKKIRRGSKKSNFRHRINALVTLTKHSLSYPRDIVDEYVNLGLGGVHLRPMSTFFLSKGSMRLLKYTVADFVAFYRKALDYIISLNIAGKNFYERTTLIFLTKILTDLDFNYLDIRSPCGAGIGQLAYNYNGDVYTCDEGRMLSRLSDESFRLGNVTSSNYSEIINHATVKAVCVASCLDNLPGCSQCVYKPYCGVCPVINYAEKNDIIVQQANSERCSMHMAILEYIFDKLKDKSSRKVFEDWVDTFKKSFYK